MISRKLFGARQLPELPSPCLAGPSMSLGESAPGLGMLKRFSASPTQMLQSARPKALGGL